MAFIFRDKPASYLEKDGERKKKKACSPIQPSSSSCKQSTKEIKPERIRNVLDKQGCDLTRLVLCKDQATQNKTEGGFRGLENWRTNVRGCFFLPL